MLLTITLDGVTEPATERALRRRDIELPAAFSEWFATATVLEPADRFSSVRKMVQELGPVLQPLIEKEAGGKVKAKPSIPAPNTLDRWLAAPSQAGVPPSVPSGEAVPPSVPSGEAVPPSVPSGQGMATDPTEFEPSEHSVTRVNDDSVPASVPTGLESQDEAASTVTGSIVDATPTPKSRRGWVLMAVAGLACAAVLVLVLQSRDSSSDPGAVTSEPGATAIRSTAAGLPGASAQPSTNPLATVSETAAASATSTTTASPSSSADTVATATGGAAVTKPPKTVAPRATGSATSKVAASSTVKAPPPTAKSTTPPPAKTTPSKPDCSNPLYADENGDLQPKPGCFP